MPYLESRRVRFDTRTSIVICESSDSHCFIRVEEDGTPARWYACTDAMSNTLIAA